MILGKHDARTEIEMNTAPMIGIVLLLVAVSMTVALLPQGNVAEPTALTAMAEDELDPALARPIINVPWSIGENAEFAFMERVKEICEKQGIPIWIEPAAPEDPDTVETSNEEQE
jgi:hypothetical protein